MSDEKARLEARMKRLKTRLRKIEEKEKKKDQRRCFLAGQAALALAEQDAGFRQTLFAALDAELSTKTERALFGFETTDTAAGATASDVGAGVSTDADPAIEPPSDAAQNPTSAPATDAVVSESHATKGLGNLFGRESKQ